jgi:hypothetical protein
MASFKHLSRLTCVAVPLDHIGGNASIYNRFGFKTCSNKVTQFRRTPPTHTKQRCTVEENVAWLLCEYDELPLLNPPQMVYQTYITRVVTCGRPSTARKWWCAQTLGPLSASSVD